jgi:serine/threonine protein kinase/beta-lactam-binding protein with PASTA domain
VATSRIADSVGRVLGDRYRLTRPLGVGASGHVYAAEDIRLRRRVAVKLLHPGLAGEEAFLRRFRRESQAVASLRHPNILRVYDWGEDEGFPYLVMELLEGGSLRSMLDRGALLSPAQAAAVGADAARALDYAHRQGLVHRDIKPANLLFDDEGRVSVADFGLARALAEAAWTEPTGAVVGTARYASPELVRGEYLDSKADVYSLALVLVEALTGRVPFATDTAFGTLMARVGRSLEVSDDAGLLKPVLESAGTAEPATRTDAGSLARALDAVSAQLPFPAPLSLASPLVSGVVEHDDMSPTEFPGRPKLFDRAEWEGGAPSAPVVIAAPPDRFEPVAAPPPPPAPPLPADQNGRGGPGEPPSTPPAGAPPRRRLRRVLLLAAAVIILVGASGVAWAELSGRFKPKEQPVPSLAGLTRVAATATLSRQHLKLAVSGTTYNPTRPAGLILTQVPAPLVKLRQGSTVTVVVSAGPQPIPVPNLANDSLQAAQQVLQSLGLKATPTYSTSMTVAANVVIANTPSSGTLLPGQAVTLNVSSGKPKVPVPPITLGTEPYSQASAALTQAGFIGQETLQYSDTVPKNAVISVNPPSGTEVVIGSPIAVAVSEGPHLVTIPTTKGQSVGAVSQQLSSLGFNVTEVKGNPLNAVKNTDPPAGTQALYGSSVTIITS